MIDAYELNLLPSTLATTMASMNEMKNPAKW